MEQFLKKIDNYVCKYLGIEKDITVPRQVLNKKNHIFIVSTFKRHVYKEPWEQYKTLSLNKETEDKKKQIGKALGSALAKGLIISFDEPSLEDKNKITI